MWFEQHYFWQYWFRYMYINMPLRVKKLKENLKCYHITQRLSFNAVYFILIISFSAQNFIYILHYIFSKTWEWRGVSNCILYKYASCGKHWYWANDDKIRLWLQSEYFFYCPMLNCYMFVWYKLFGKNIHFKYQHIYVVNKFTQWLSHFKIQWLAVLTIMQALKAGLWTFFFLLYNNRNLTTRTMGKQCPENFISEYYMYIHNFIDKL